MTGKGRKGSGKPGSTVTLQVGQCGNQLGACWFDRLEQHIGEDPDAVQSFFRVNDDGRKAARCVLVDTEPRAVGKRSVISSSSSLGAARGAAGRWS